MNFFESVFELMSRAIHTTVGSNKKCYHSGQKFSQPISSRKSLVTSQKIFFLPLVVVWVPGFAVFTMNCDMDGWVFTGLFMVFVVLVVVLSVFTRNFAIDGVVLTCLFLVFVVGFAILLFAGFDGGNFAGFFFVLGGGGGGFSIFGMVFVLVFVAVVVSFVLVVVFVVNSVLVSASISLFRLV